MSICEAPQGVRPQPLVGTFEPSVELLEKYRRILASSPPTSHASTPRSLSLPFWLEQSRSAMPTKYISFAPLPNTEHKDVHAVKETIPKPRNLVAKRSSPPSLPYLIHPNIVDALDILQDGRGEYAVTFTTMTTLEIIIARSRRLSTLEADCYFKQATMGVSYLHNSGVAHQNLRPENLVVTINGVLKIANFDAAEMFSPLRKSKDQTSQIVSVRPRQRWSSAEYIAPEVFIESSFDPRPVDMWALGVLYMEMRIGRRLWSFAAAGADDNYDRYLQERHAMWGYRPIENLNDEHCRRVIGGLLDPNPSSRYTAARVLRSTWCRSIEIDSIKINESQ